MLGLYTNRRQMKPWIVWEIFLKYTDGQKQSILSAQVWTREPTIILDNWVTWICFQLDIFYLMSSLLSTTGVSIPSWNSSEVESVQGIIWYSPHQQHLFNMFVPHKSIKVWVPLYPNSTSSMELCCIGTLIHLDGFPQCITLWSLTKCSLGCCPLRERED